MAFEKNSQSVEVRNVTGINEEQRKLIHAFLQGAVYTWCKNRMDEWFSMRDLMGGENYYWQETPLFCLYEKHKNSGKSDKEAIDAAGKDSGWLLKYVINADKRIFKTKEEDLIRKYQWVRVA